MFSIQLSAPKPALDIARPAVLINTPIDPLVDAEDARELWPCGAGLTRMQGRKQRCDAVGQKLLSPGVDLHRILVLGNRMPSTA